MDFDYWVLWGYAVFYCFLAMLAIHLYNNTKNQNFINREDVPIKNKNRRTRRHRNRCLQETDSEH